MYAAEIINVLETIHSNNVMHRDLKPENVLITSDYHVKVVSKISSTVFINRLISETQIT